MQVEMRTVSIRMMRAMFCVAIAGFALSLLLPVKAHAQAPEIEVRRGAGIIPDNSGETALGTMFEQFLGGQTSTVTLTIHNTGSANLDLPSGVVMTGINASDFTVISQPTATVPPSGSTTFTIQFDASGLGWRFADVSIANNDSDENPYNFVIRGRGLQAPDFSKVFSPAIIDSGDISTINFTIQHFFFQDLTNVAFTDSLPASVTIATPSNAINNCGGTLTSSSGSSTITLANGTVSANSTCTISVDVISAVTGSHNNTTGALTAKSPLVTATGTLTAYTGSTASATLTVNQPIPTSQIIADYLGARNTLLLQNEPDRHRRLDRLNGSVAGNSTGMVSAFGAKLPAPFGVDARLSKDSFSFSTSLKKAAASTQNFAGSRDTALAGSGWDVWVEGHFMRPKGGNFSNGDFGVIYAGADYLIRPGALVGIMVQHDWLDGDIGYVSGLSSSTADVSGRGWMAGPYASVKLKDNLVLDIRALWGRSQNEIRAANGYRDNFDTRRWLVSGALVGEYNYGLWNARPEISLKYIEEHQSAHTDSLNVVIPAQTVSQGELRFGPRFIYTHETGDGSVLQPFVEVQGAYGFGEEGRFSSGSFADQFQGLTGSVKAGVNLTAANGASLMISAQYDGIGVEAGSYGGMVMLTIPLH